MELLLPLLIDSAELNSLLNDDELSVEEPSKFDEQFRIVEVHFGQDDLVEYKMDHIKKAIYIDMIKGVVSTELLPKDVPDVATFEQYLSSLGIANIHHIIIYDRSEFGIWFSARFWSILRLFGHERLSILKGGYKNWKANSFVTSTEEPAFKPQSFEISFNYNLFRYYNQIRKNLKTQEETIVDARPSQDFIKTIQVDGVEKPNHIPKSKNVPFTELFDKKGLKSKEELEIVFKERQIDLRNRRMIASCNTGVKACILQLAFYLVGLKNVPVYYGSWTEYSKRAEEDDKYTFKVFGPEEKTSRNQTRSSMCTLV